jgi:DNA-binding NarL/FixJ family response regulator
LGDAALAHRTLGGATVNRGFALTINHDLRQETSARLDAGDRTIRLLIVDAHPLVRWALTHIADSTPDLKTIGEAETATDAVNLVYSLTPDVVTIDCSLADAQGWQLANDLRNRYPHLGIVVLTTSASDDLLFRALHSGASAYVSKEAPVKEVVAAIRHAAVSASSFSASGLSQALRRERQTERLTLSRREQQVLTLLRDGHSVPQVAATLYVSLSTAKTYVARVYEKLGASNRAQALMTAVKLGLFDETALAV